MYLNLQSVQLHVSMAPHWPELQAQHLMPTYQAFRASSLRFFCLFVCLYDINFTEIGMLCPLFLSPTLE